MAMVKGRKLTFGIMLGPTTPWQRMEEQAQQVESLGFDKLWLPDHFVNPEDLEMDWFECWTTLAALTSHTNKISLGTLVSSMTLRNPAMLARMALTVDHISGGRLELGVGAGGVPNCHKMTGVPQWNRRERSERYKEFIEILDHMLKQELTTYQGKFYNIQEALMRPASISKPHPVFNIAAHGPRALGLAAKYGDAWNTLSPGNDLTPKEHSDNTRQRCEMMSKFAIEAGRDPNKIGRTMLFGWTSDRLFSSLDAFCDTIGRYQEAGINDFCFIYALGMESWEGQAIITEDQLLQISKEAIPAIKNTA
ncbi:MAG: LLM class flavin-dependent oxidoreductase [Anaerolineaceae bacterium]|jgi:alkanesulfonate monooxygenase SsuD/methylene tetrahydromethanopterin reductase-like flavin-dependent oxidoreductase (luciferase family)|nr:LLM class flavin-dependent oxidoreductase [Anaerolineaceae bacterium]